MSDLLFFVFGIAAVLASPGPTNALLCTSAGLVGTRRSTPLILSELGGYFVSISILRLIGGPLIAAMPSFGVVLRLVLIGYLLWLSWRLWRIDPSMIRKDVRIVTLGQVFVTTLLNPKALLFAFALYPTLQEGQSILPYALVFAGTVVCMASAWITFGAFVGRMDDGNMGRVLPRIAGVVLSVLAMVIAGSMVAARI